MLPARRVAPLTSADGAQVDQVVQQAGEVGQVGVHAMHVAEVRVRMHAGRVDNDLSG